MASAFSSITATAAATSPRPVSDAASESADAITLPSTGVILNCGSLFDIRPSAMSLKPLNTDSTHTIAAVATATPAIDTIDMILTALWVFFENR